MDWSVFSCFDSIIIDIKYYTLMKSTILAKYRKRKLHFNGNSQNFFWQLMSRYALAEIEYWQSSRRWRRVRRRRVPKPVRWRHWLRMQLMSIDGKERSSRWKWRHTNTPSTRRDVSIESDWMRHRRFWFTACPKFSYRTF